jgi:hypothetical protein
VQYHSSALVLRREVPSNQVKLLLALMPEKLHVYEEGQRATKTTTPQLARVLESLAWPTVYRINSFSPSATSVLFSHLKRHFS